MDSTKLDQEKFDTLKELADLQSNISTGRANLMKLQAATEEYMQTRERGAEERILRVLKESRDVLEEINTNHNELSKYNEELEAYANELKDLASGIVALFGNFRSRMDDADADMKAGEDRTKSVLTEIKVNRVAIQQERDQLQRERAIVRDEWRLLRDRQQTLKAGFDELRKLKNKQI